jgi:hypothetical protein
MNEVGRGIWQAQRVRLRAIEPADWPIYFAWNQDDEQARILAAIPFPQSEEAVRQWAPRESTRTATDDGYRLVIEDARGEVVGMLPARKFPVFSVSRRPGDREMGRDVAQVVANGGVADDDRANAAMTPDSAMLRARGRSAIRGSRYYLAHTIVPGPPWQNRSGEPGLGEQRDGWLSLRCLDETSVRGGRRWRSRWTARPWRT